MTMNNNLTQHWGYWSHTRTFLSAYQKNKWVTECMWFGYSVVVRIVLCCMLCPCVRDKILHTLTLPSASPSSPWRSGPWSRKGYLRRLGTPALSWRKNKSDGCWLNCIASRRGNRLEVVNGVDGWLAVLIIEDNADSYTTLYRGPSDTSYNVRKRRKYG